MLMQGWSPVLHSVIIGTLAYIALVVCLRLSGKRTLSQWNAFDAVVTFALGSMVATATLSPQTSVVQAVVAFALFVLLQFVVTWLAVRSSAVRKLVKARPTLLVNEGRMDREAMKRERVAEAEILAALRNRGLASVSDAYAVVLETSGAFSVIERSENDDYSAMADVHNRERENGRPQAHTRGLRQKPRPVATSPSAHFAVRLWENIRHDDVFNGGAALGFYLTLAVFPAMIFLMALVPYLPIAHVDEAIMDLVRQALPDGAANVFSKVVEEVASEQRGALLSFGIAGALWAASTGMYAVMQQLNVAFDVPERRGFVLGRVTALMLTLFFGALVLAAFSLIVLGGVVQGWIGTRLGFSPVLLDFFIVFRWVVIVLTLLFAIALVYRFAPNRRHRFRLLTPGSAAATALMIVASLGFSLYTKHFAHYSAVYGSIGAVIILMMSLYVSGLVILIGAEIDAMLEDHDFQREEQKVHQRPRHERPAAPLRRAADRRRVDGLGVDARS